MPDPTSPGAPPPDAPRTRARNAAVALGVAVALLSAVLVGVAITSRRGRGASTTSTTSTTASAATTTTAGATSLPAVPEPTTSAAVPTPATVVAASEQKLVVLDSATGRTVRTLFDLGVSKPTDAAPPSIGSVALTADATTAYFDLVAEAGSTMRRAPVAGGPAEDLGGGRAPSPTPDSAGFAFLRANGSGGDDLVIRGSGGDRAISLPETGCGAVAWSPDGKRIAVDLCANGEPTTVAEVDVAAGKATSLTAPAGVRWTAPTYRPDGALTLAEDRSGDSVVVTVAGGRVTGALFRRDRTTIVCLDWDRGRSVLFCESDGTVWVGPAGGEPHVVGTGYRAAAW